MMEDFESIIGLEYLSGVHLNDSVGKWFMVYHILMSKKQGTNLESPIGAHKKVID